MIAVYPGSFDPLTAGHLSIIHQGVKLFSHLVVLVAVNPQKKYLLTVDQRVGLINSAVARYPSVRVASTSGLVVEYARAIGAGVLLRGIRGATDAAFETTLAQENRILAPEIATILLPAEAHLSEVSSGELKRMAARGADLSPYCTTDVAALLHVEFLGKERP